MDFERIFAIIGVATAVGAVLLFLQAANAFKPIEVMCRKIVDTVRRYRRLYYAHGPRGIRYRIGLRLIAPYLDVRYFRLKKINREMQENGRPQEDDRFSRDQWDRRFAQTNGALIELMHIARLESVGEKE